MKRGLSATTVTALVAGFAFLYLPILLLVLFSFNESRLVTVWGGFSLRWYRALPENRALLEAAWVSLRVAAIGATLATVLGTLAALALARFGRFRGRTPLAGMVYAPLIMPEVITGLSLLLLFVALDWERGLLTVAAAHATFATAFAAVIVHARLIRLDPSYEEAAADLGAPPVAVFRRVTLPMIAPAVASAWLLAFALSLDDFVVAAFTSGPGATTLPMKIYSQVRLGVTPEINAVSTLLIAAVALVVIAATLAQKRQLARRASTLF